MKQNQRQLIAFHFFSLSECSRGIAAVFFRMYCTVYTTGFGNVVYINPNCNMKLIYEYLRVAIEVNDSQEIDLCTDNGRLLGIYEAPCSASGLDYFSPRANYFVLTFDYVENSGELFNPRTLMPHTNKDFDEVFLRIKRAFMIPLTETINDDDALLIFEHMLLAYKEKTDLFKNSDGFNVKRSPEKKNPSHSNTTVSGGKGSKYSSEYNILAQWRAEKRNQLAALKAEDSEDSVFRRKSFLYKSNTSNGYKTEDAEEGIPEEQKACVKTAKESLKRKSQTGGKKAAKKAVKKTGKNQKQETQLLRAVHSNFDESVSSYVNFNCHLVDSTVPLAPYNSVSGDDLKTLRKSQLFAKSQCQKTAEPARQPPYESIRQFFRDHPNHLHGLPKPPAAEKGFRTSEKPEMTRKDVTSAASKKKKKIVTRPLVKRQKRICKQ